MSEITQTPEQLAAAKEVELKAAKTEADQKAIVTNAPGIEKLLGHALKPETRKPVVEKTPEELAADAEKKKVDDAAKAEAKKKAAKKKPDEAKAPVVAAVDPEKIAEAAARGTVKALDERDAAREKDKKPATEQDPHPYLDERQKRKLPVLEQMEKMFPEEYKGIKAKYAASMKALQEYQAEWQKENPDKDWNAEDKEHNEFFTKNDVDWDSEDYAEAAAEVKSDVKVTKAKDEWKKESEGEFKKITDKERARELEPLAVGESVRNARSLFESLGDEEWAKVRLPNGAVNEEVLRKLNVDDPDKTGMIIQSAVNLEKLTAEHFRIFNGIVPFDLNKTEHKVLSDYAIAQENAMLELPPQDRTDADNRMFATAKEYYAMTKAEQKHHWTFTMGDLNTLLAADFSTNLKKQLANEEAKALRMAEKRGYKKVNGEGVVEEPEPQKQPVTAKEEPAGEEVFKPRQVGSVTDVALAQMRGKKLTGSNSGVNQFLAPFK